jgi:hypothetical protein
LKREVKGGFMFKLQISKSAMSKDARQKAWEGVVHCLLGTCAEHAIKLKSKRAKYKQKNAAAKAT